MQKQDFIGDNKLAVREYYVNQLQDMSYPRRRIVWSVLNTFFVDINKPYTQVNKDDINKYIQWCVYLKKKKSTITYNLYKIRKFYNYLKTKELVSENPVPDKFFIPIIKQEESPISQKNRDDFRRMKLHVNWGNYKPQHKALWYLFFYTISRIECFNKIRIEDISLPEHIIYLRDDKNVSEFKYITLPRIVIRKLRIYLRNRTINTPYLFYGVNGRQMNVLTIRKMLRRITLNACFPLTRFEDMYKFKIATALSAGVHREFLIQVFGEKFRRCVDEMSLKIPVKVDPLREARKFSNCLHTFTIPRKKRNRRKNEYNTTTDI